MSSFDLFGEFKRQAKLSSLTERVRTHYDRAKYIADASVESARQEGVKAIEHKKELYAQKIGLPTAESSAEEKEAYKNFISPRASAIMGQVNGFANQEKLVLSNKQVRTAKALKSLAGKQDPTVSASELADAMNAGWGNGELHTGVLDIFNKTADARATALGITKFRGTNGAMGTLNSARSLFYKDNTHLNDGVVVAGVLGGTLATGMLAGKAIGAGLDAAYVDRD